ncbi:MAG: bifunctional ADP-dependent (S)-NAD(P)H-hydrate dehydratase/NAD(P)H-hydrate epimerase [Micrococcales bacterium]|nr:bifunctional ADP-dependent (S)-NAD(P)H-hydrate dehydratase/NAD(P)H-hydrate epimerase [Micrococcales bacterium]
MQVAHRADDVREAEAPLLEAGLPLMEHAAFALATHVLAELRAARGSVAGSRVAALVGAGNNGGDGLHAAAVLARRGVSTLVVTTTDNPHPGGLAAATAAGSRVVSLADAGTDAVRDLVADTDLLIDALVGIGSDGSGVRGQAGRLLDALAQTWGAVETGGAAGAGRRARPVVVAVDVPSGTGVDDGRHTGTVLPADLTVTFGTLKPGLLLPPADRLAGRVALVDIGLDLGAAPPAVRRLTDADVAALWPVPDHAAHKYTRGVLGLVAGSDRYPGAAVLAAHGAVGAGVGMVRFVDVRDRPGPLAASVLAARPEVVVGAGQVQAWAAGSGIDPADPSRRDDLARVLAAAHDGVPVVLDAGALLCAPRDERLGPHVVLTPHPGELADLLTRWGIPTTRAQVEAAPLAAASAAHGHTGATVALKGSSTVVVGPGATFAQADASAWLATAGTGDVLTGVLGALLSGCAERIGDDPSLPATLAALAALVHGRAAHRANPGGPVGALDVARAVPTTVAALLAG